MANKTTLIQHYEDGVEGAGSIPKFCLVRESGPR